MPNLTSSGLLQYADYTPTTPDIIRIAGTDPSGAAPILSVTQPAAVGETMMVQLNFAGDAGGVDFGYLVPKGADVNSVARWFAQEITANPTCVAAGVAGEWTPHSNEFAVNHRSGEPVAISVIAHPECFQLLPAATAALDAGPILAIDRNPGFPPPPGSNIGQIVFTAPDASGNDIEWGVVSCNILDNRPGQWNAEIAFYTVGNNNGAAYPIKRFAIAGESGWQTMNPNVRAAEGALGPVNASCRYLVQDGVCTVNYTIEIADNGNGRNFLVADLPLPPAPGRDAYLAGRNKLTPGNALQGWVSSPTQISIVSIDNSYPVPGQKALLVLSGQYETG